MKHMKSWLVLVMIITSMSLNYYLYCEKEGVSNSLAAADRSIKQKQAMISLASKRQDTVSHRLAMPSNRLSISDEFQQISKKLRLARLDFQISPETDISNTLTESTVEIKFTNSSDQPLFHMINHIIQDFPGVVYPLEIIMWREPGGGEPTIHGKFRFEWIKSNGGEL